MFRRSLVGCLFCIYLPLMGVSYLLVNAGSSRGSSVNGIDNLHRQSFPHGSFYFGATSHETSIPDKLALRHSPNATQQKILDDEDIDAAVEKQRCKRYGFGYSDETLSRRRRLFLGSIISDDSMERLEAVSLEAYNIFHTVSFIESNVTQNLTPRDWVYGVKSKNLSKLQQRFGPQTRVSVDYYVTSLISTEGDVALTARLQWEGIYLRWKMNGMTEADAAIAADPDTTFSRDFLRALQVCDVPEFRRGQSEGGKSLPIYYLNDQARASRHLQ